MSTSLKVGDRVELDIGAIANGGHFVARHEGQVVFVRHAIEGERALVEITSANAKLARGEAIEILKASPNRTSPKCGFAGVGKCGGCDFQHIEIEKQITFKEQVVREIFTRIAKMEIDFKIQQVEPLNGFNWRTRVDFAVSNNGKLGFYSSRTNSIIEISHCPALVEPINKLDIFDRQWRGEDRVEVAATNTGQVNVSRGGRTIEGQSQLIEKVGETEFEVSPSSFWQGHIAAPLVLTEKVKDLIELKSEDHLLDLYGGAGLFAKTLIESGIPLGKVHLIESNEKAAGDSAKTFKKYGKLVSVHMGRVEQRLSQIKKADVVVADPPRSGMGESVINELVKLSPRKIIYVSCDPASLARDAALLVSNGYKLGHISGYDLFPHTQHIECVASFSRG